MPSPPALPAVIVDIHATALNHADLSQRAGNYPPPGATDILGLEMAGVISRLGEKVAGWQIGDRVCALLPGGGYAEKVAVPQAMLMPIPTGWSFEAAGLRSLSHSLCQSLHRLRSSRVKASWCMAVPAAWAPQPSSF